MKNLIKLSILKTIKFNIHYFGLKGLKIPVLVSKYCSLKKLKGKVYIKNPSFGCIRIGFGELPTIDKRTNKVMINNMGTILFDTKCNIMYGTKISNWGVLCLGKNFRCVQTKFIVKKEIKIGDDSMISWNTTLMDTDFHKIINLEDGTCCNLDKEILIGNHVFIWSNCTILKGSEIQNDSVLAANSTLTKKINEKFCIIGTNKVLKSNINWEN